MRSKRKVAVAIAMGCLVVGGLAATATAGVLHVLYNTPYATTQMFGSSGNIVQLGPTGAGGPITPGTVGSVLPGGCMSIGVGDFTPSAPCSSYLNLPYQLTQTPITASNNSTITYFAVTTTKASPSSGDRIVFQVRLCENAANSCATGSPGGGLTIAKCSPVAGSKTCSWIGKLRIEQWQPGGPSSACPGGTGICHSKDPGTHDQGLIDVVASRGCGSTCPKGTYDPGNVSWSVAYSTIHP